jgi:hypothetical protein
VSVTVKGLTRASGSRLAAFLFRVGSFDGLAGFVVAVDADPFTVTELVREPDRQAGLTSWPSFSQTVAIVPTGTYNLRIWVTRTLGPYSAWLPADVPDLRGCMVVVTVAEGQRTDVRVTGIPAKWSHDANTVCSTE